MYKNEAGKESNVVNRDSGNASLCLLPQIPTSSTPSSSFCTSSDVGIQKMTQSHFALGCGSFAIPTTTSPLDTPLKSTSNLQMRRKPSATCPYIVLPIQPMPPPLPPPPANPVLTPLKMRSPSKSWAAFSTRSLGNHEVPPATAGLAYSAMRKVSAPPPPASKPLILNSEHNRHSDGCESVSKGIPRLHALPVEMSEIVAVTTRSNGDSHHTLVFLLHSSLLIVSFILWIAGLIVLLPSLCIAYCVRFVVGIAWHALGSHPFRGQPVGDYLTSSSLRNLPTSPTSSVLVVAVYLGSPGIRLHVLKRLLAERIFESYPDATDEVSPEFQQSYCMFLARLHQHVVSLPIGYTWQHCSTVSIDDHVSPAFLVGGDFGRTDGEGRRLNRGGSGGLGGMRDNDSVEQLVAQLSTAPLPADKPLWQAHLVEEYLDSKDALTIRRKDSPLVSGQDKTYLTPWRNSIRLPSSTFASGGGRSSPTSSESNSPQRSLRGSPSLLVNRQPRQPGSLVIFRVHSSVIDDVQSLVDFLTLLLADQDREKPKASAAEIGTSISDYSHHSRHPHASKRASIVEERSGVVQLSDETEENNVEAWCSTGIPSRRRLLQDYLSIFCAWVVELNQLWREVGRSLFIGPFLVFRNLMLMPRDTGLRLPLLSTPTPSFEDSEHVLATTKVRRQVFRRFQLPLDKLLHIQKVTTASFTEIIMALLAGSLRAYQQTSGLMSPSDLLIRVHNPLTTFDREWSKLNLLNRRDHTTAASEAAPPVYSSSRLIGQCIPVVMRLPVCGDGEGLLPRLWKVHQRLHWVQKSGVTRTLAWMRDLVYNLLPHVCAVRVDDALLAAGKCSLTYAAVSLDRHHRGTAAGARELKDSQHTSLFLPHRSRKSRQRRLDKQEKAKRKQHRNQVSLQIDIKEALRLVNRSTGDRSPTSQHQLKKTTLELVERNLDLLYLPEGVPIVRIDAWFSTQYLLLPEEVNTTSSLAVATRNVNEQPQQDGGCDCRQSQKQCRGLAMVSCVYGGQLSLGLTGCIRLKGSPDVDLILLAMHRQLNQLYKLLDSRFPAKSMVQPTSPIRRFASHNAPIETINDRSINSATSLPLQTMKLQPPLPSLCSANFIPTSSSQLATLNINANATELFESDSPQFLKYNFPPISSGFRRSSFRCITKRHNQSASTTTEPKSENTANNIIPSFLPRALVPILKTSPSYHRENYSKSNQEVLSDDSPRSSQFLKRQASEMKDKLFPNHLDYTKRPRTQKRDIKSHRAIVHPKNRFTSRFIRTFRKAADKVITPPVPRRPQVRFAAVEK